MANTHSIAQLIALLEPNQKDYVPRYNSDFIANVTVSKTPIKSTLVDHLSESLTSTVLGWKKTFGFSDEEISKINIQPVGRKNSLYASILSILQKQYNISVYNQKLEMIETFIRFLIAKMELDTKTKQLMKKCQIKQNLLIDEIKNTNYQSNNVVYYISLIFDLNIVILTQSDIEIYYCDETYDDCKPHILLYRDFCQIYYPINYHTIQHHSINSNSIDSNSMDSNSIDSNSIDCNSIQQIGILIYFDDPIIKQIIDQCNNKKVNKTSYWPQKSNQ